MLKEAVLTKYYRFGEYTIASTLPLNLEKGLPFHTCCHFVLVSSASPYPHCPEHSLAQPVDFYSDAHAWPVIAKNKLGYHFHFPEFADFQTSASNPHTIAYPMPGITDATLAQLFLHQIFPLLLSLYEPLVLHASAVSSRYGALAFLGESGQGKSTLASYLQSSDFFSFLTDDCLFIRKVQHQFKVYGNATEVRLWQDSMHTYADQQPALYPPVAYTIKKSLSISENNSRTRMAPDKAAAIHSLFILADDHANTDTLQIKRLSLREAVISLVKSTFRLNDDSTMETIRIDSYISLASAIPVFHLNYPRTYGYLAKVRLALLEHLERYS